MASKCSAAEMTYFYPRSPCGERRNKHTIITGGKHFYPRSPCGERPAVTTSITLSLRFLSTLSLRRATPVKSESLTTYFISIHALLAESDPVCALRVTSKTHFYPRSPCGERRFTVHPFPRCSENISIHALLAESDTPLLRPLPCGAANFYPRSPCGERHANIHAFYHCAQFLSTLSLRRATC